LPQIGGGRGFASGKPDAIRYDAHAPRLLQRGAAVISNQTTAPSETPQAARQAALNAVLRRLVAVPPPGRAGASAPVPPRPTPPKAAPSAPTPPAPVPRWLAAPVLRLAIPDTPLAVGTGAPPQPAPPPPPKPQPQPQPEAAAGAVIDVPPLVEPIADRKPEPAPDLAARIMGEIAAIVARAPQAIPPAAVDLSALKAPDRPADAPAPAVAPATPPETPAATQPAATLATPPAEPQSTPVPSARTEPARRVSVRRTRPRVARPQRRISAPPPPKRAVAAESPGRPERAGNTARPARPRLAAAAAQPVFAPSLPSSLPAAPSPAARAPARERPALAPAATSVARTLRTAAVPETRPLTQNRRLYRRVKLTAELEIAGKPCRLVDLSIGGFAAAGTDKLDQGALVPVTLRMTIDGINIGTQFSARMVYGNGARAAGRFVDLTGAQTAFLRYIVTWRGEAIGAVGTTTLLDAITRWPERAFQPHPSTIKQPAPERPGFWSRLIGRIPLLGWRRRE
jgi:hypothetical protein